MLYLSLHTIYCICHWGNSHCMLSGSLVATAVDLTKRGCGSPCIPSHDAVLRTYVYANNEGGVMLRWWTSEEQVKQSPPVPTHSADLRGRHRIRKGSWGAGPELHVYEVFGRVEAVRRDSGLTVWAASPPGCSCCSESLSKEGNSQSTAR